MKSIVLLLLIGILLVSGCCCCCPGGGGGIDTFLPNTPMGNECSTDFDCGYDESCSYGYCV